MAALRTSVLLLVLVDALMAAPAEVQHSRTRRAACDIGNAGDTCQYACDPMDVMFVIDTSDETQPDIVQNFQTLATKLVDRLDVGPNNVRFGVIVYGESPLQLLGWQDNADKATTISTLNNVVNNRMTGERNTPEALFAARIQLMQNTRDVDKMLVLMQSDKSKDDKNIKKEIKKFPDDVWRYAVGIDVEKKNLDEVASDPHDDFRIEIKDPLTTDASVADLMETLRTLMCKQIKIDHCESQPCQNGGICQSGGATFQCDCPKGFSGDTCENDCRQADIVFVLDMSSSVGQKNWDNYLIPFVTELADHFSINPDNAQFGMATFSKTATLQWGLSQHTSNPSFINAVNALPYSGSGTCIACGLDSALEIYNRADDRVKVPNLVITITDGQSNIPVNPATAYTLASAQALVNDGAQCVSIPVTTAVNAEESLAIAGGDANYVIEMESFDVMTLKVVNVYNDICAMISNLPCNSNPCQNNAECINVDKTTLYKCVCPVGFTGINCDTSLCSPTACNNGGTCDPVDGSCICPAGFSGTTCEISACDPNPCSNGGTCNIADGKCSCPIGAAGDKCEILICNPTPCGNGGICTPTATGVFTCTCTLGFIGNLCETPVCTDTTCLNGGQCTPLLSGGYMCVCPAGFTGANCDTETQQDACTGKLEIAAVVDSSRSILDEQFKLLKDFIKGFVNKIDKLGPDGIQMSLFDFSSSVLQNIGLTEFTDKAAYAQAVDDRLIHLKEATYTHKAFKAARETGFLGARPDVPKTMVMITDGDPTFFYVDDAYAESDQIRAEGIDLIIIAIGQDVTLDKMVRMAGGDTSKVISVDSLTEVYSVLDNLAESVCKENEEKKMCFICDPLNNNPPDAGAAPALCGPQALTDEIQNALIELGAVKECSNCFIQETQGPSGTVYVRGCADDLLGTLPGDPTTYPEHIPVCFDFPDTPAGTQTCFCSGDKCNDDQFIGILESLDCPPMEYCVVLDTSTSVDQTEMIQQKDFVKLIFKTLDKSTTGGPAKFGMVIFGGLPAKLAFDVNEYGTLNEVQAAVDNADEINWGTNTYDGFNIAGSLCFGAMPSNNQRTVILLTDGLSSNKTATVQAAEQISNDLGAMRVAIGVDEADLSELADIVGNDITKYFKAPSFADLNEDLVKKSMASVCNQPTPPVLPPPVSCLVCDPNEAMTAGQCVSQPLSPELYFAFSDAGFVETGCQYCLVQKTADPNVMPRWCVNDAFVAAHPELQLPTYVTPESSTCYTPTNGDPAVCACYVAESNNDVTKICNGLDTDSLGASGLAGTEQGCICPGACGSFTCTYTYGQQAAVCDCTACNCN